MGLGQSGCRRGLIFIAYAPSPRSLRTSSLLNLELVAITAASAPTASTSTSSAAPAAPAAPAAAPAAAVAARLLARSDNEVAAADVGAVELRDQPLGVGRDLDLDLCTNQTVSRVLGENAVAQAESSGEKP